MLKQLGIPYMGSKRKLASKIVDYILLQNPNTKYVYDLFGGGGAISFEFLQREQIKTVFYNELNTAVCELLKKIQKDSVTDEFYNWISREEFEKLKKDNDWKAGLVKTCWSFGNNQKNYIFGKGIEKLKKEAHDFLIKNGYLQNKSLRLKLTTKFKNKMKIEGRFQLQQLLQLEQLEQLQQLQRLQQLEQLEKLERLEQLQQLQQLQISNKSYENVKITTPKNETIIYLDPPYFNTAKYQEDLDHQKFYQWIEKMTKEGWKIYLSSYESHLYLVQEFVHRSLLSAAANNKVCEKLFTNFKDKKSSFF